MWKDIFNQTKTIDDFISEGKTMHGQENYRRVEKINSFENLDEMLPLLAFNDEFKNENGSYKIKSFTIDIDPYLNNKDNSNYWNQRGLGLYKAWTLLSKDTDNYIYAGDIIDENEELTNYNFNILKTMIKEKIIPNNNQGNIILKVHPRSENEAINKLMEKINNEFKGTLNRDVIINLKQTVIIEVYILSGLIKNDAKTKYHFSVNGTSTSVLGFYAANQIEMIDEFIFENQNALDQYKKYYGENSNIIDWSKVIKAWK
ncbi:polysialyltransferase family glycosyltransferase [Spiroplasma taiwanense]|uniref:Uncharacterized protein n=1 Tax=Spiroplasma taiwanense CT-1 TaxID=1276220 RepID=S5MHN7_9MOLU|nr:polysialyltransferase family glycosyltransferase [Spiroplasma taiwanense]AGR41380.1 hypothetical protein STAIW_v1c07840 [Spiroplasma taiwanense CT-1]